jgi:dihydrofolate reductase
MNVEEKESKVVYKNLSIIVAIDEKFAIGKNNQLLWHLPNDLKFFKKTTSGHSIIMGRKTFDSIGKPLPNRRNIVISRNNKLDINGVEIFNSIKEALVTCYTEEEVFIIGGAEIYKQALPFTNKIYLTKVHHQFDADTYLSELNFDEWRIVNQEDHQQDERHLYRYSFIILERISL